MSNTVLPTEVARMLAAIENAANRSRKRAKQLDELPLKVPESGRWRDVRDCDQVIGRYYVIRRVWSEVAGCVFR